MEDTPIRTGVLAFLAVVVILALCITGSVVGCGAYKNWHRGQQRANARNQVAISQIKAHNNVTLTKIAIQRAQQQARINYAQIAATKAEADKRYQEAVGIRRAQDEISSTLTPIYIQHEAIQAQERIATSGKNNTVIYVPAGTNGTPVLTQEAAGK